MDPQLLRTAVQPFIDLFGALMLSGAATTIATQILKLKVIPVPAEKYPRMSAAIVSALASLVAVFSTNVDLVINSFIGWLAFAAGAYLLSAITYNQIVKQEEEIHVSNNLGASINPPR